MSQDKDEIASGKPSEAQAVDRILEPIVQLSPCPCCGVVPDKANFRCGDVCYDYAEGYRIFCTDRDCPTRPNVCSRNRQGAESGQPEDITRRWNALTKEEAESERYAHFFAL